MKMDTKKGKSLHLFICCNQREGKKTCCANRDALELVATLKKTIKSHKDLKGSVQVTKTGCLGPCSKGIAAVLYPDRIWLTKVKSADSKKIVTFLKDAMKNRGELKKNLGPDELGPMLDEETAYQ